MHVGYWTITHLKTLTKTIYCLSPFRLTIPHELHLTPWLSLLLITFTTHLQPLWLLLFLIFPLNRLLLPLRCYIRHYPSVSYWSYVLPKSILTNHWRRTIHIWIHILLLLSYLVTSLWLLVLTDFVVSYSLFGSGRRYERYSRFDGVLFWMFWEWG